MTPRRIRAQKLAIAAVAARAADAWIGEAKRTQSLALAIGEHDARVYGAQLLTARRIARRYAAYAAPLAAAMQRRPVLGDYLASPERLQRLALFAGAALVGGGMVRFVSRRSVSELVGALGEDVWAYGLAHGKMPIKAVRDEDDMIERIANEGTRAVYVYLEAIAPRLGDDAFAIAELDAAHNIPPQDQDALSAAVDGALEHVSP